MTIRLRLLPVILLIVATFNIYIFLTQSAKEETKTTTEGNITYIIENGHKVPLEKRSVTAPTLQQLLGCVDQEAAPRYSMRGDYWVLTNYVRAERSVGCAESVTYTTHADHTFLDNLAPLLRRWQGPVSVSVFAPGADWRRTLEAVQRARLCGPDAHLVREWTTFHIYFPNDHLPKMQVHFPAADGISHLLPVNCADTQDNSTLALTYRKINKILYPVNVGRNVAREEATTHFVLASDIELYPSPGFIPDFLEMVKRQLMSSDTSSANSVTRPRVYPLNLFEVKKDANVPNNKTELFQMLKTKDAIPFHEQICSACHTMPQSYYWLKQPQTKGLHVFHVAQRSGEFVHWEPIYVGTNAEPEYDERLSWEGRNDKMTQGYAMCLLEYEFHILDNAFLVHRPGIKVYRKNSDTELLVNQTNVLIKEKYRLEIEMLYGTRKGCSITL